MPGPKITENDVTMFPMLKNVAEQLYRDLIKSPKLMQVYQEQNTYNDSQETVTPNILRNNLRALNGQVDPAFNDALSAFDKVYSTLDSLSDSSARQPKEFAKKWNTMVDNLSKLNGYDEDGVFHPEKSLSALVHTVYGAGDYGNMTKDPNAQVLLALGAESSIALMTMSNVERDFQISRLEQQQILDNRSGLEEEKNFFTSLQENPEMTRIISDDKVYADYMKTSGERIEMLNGEKTKSDEALDAELLTRKDVIDEVFTLKKQAEEQVRAEMEPKQADALEYQKSLYRKNYDLERQETEKENREIEAENAEIRSSNKEIQDKIAAVEADRNAKLKQLEGINRRDFIEAEMLKYENQVSSAVNLKEKLVEERKDKSAVLTNMEKLSRAKEFLADPQNIPSEQQLKGVDAAKQDYKTLEGLYQDLTGKFGHISSLTGLDKMLEDPKNTRKTLGKINDLEKNFHDAEQKLKENKNAKNTDKLNKNVNEAKAKWEKAKESAGWSAGDLEAFNMVEKFLDENKAVKADYEQARKVNPKMQPMTVLGDISDKYLTKAKDAEAEFKSYFDSKYVVDTLKTITDSNGKHYETLLDTMDDIRTDIVNLDAQIKGQDAVINFDGYRADVEKRAEGLLEGDQREAIRTEIRSQANKEINELKTGIREEQPLKHIKSKEEVEAAVNDDVYDFTVTQNNELNDAIEAKQKEAQKACLAEKRDIYRNAVAKNHAAALKEQTVVTNTRTKAAQLMEKSKERTEKANVMNAELQTVKAGKNDILGRVQSYLDQTLSQVDMGKRRFHRDSKEFLAMKNGLTELSQFMKDNKGKLEQRDNDTLQTFQQKLNRLSETARHYKDTKLNELHIGKPTNMRLLRLRFAEDLASFTAKADTEIGTMKSLEDTKMKNVETKLVQHSRNPNVKGPEMKTESLNEFVKSGITNYKKPVRQQPIQQHVEKAVNKEISLPGLPGKG